ncbi:MAG: hypothetical protein ACOC93_03585 [Planctomycetota bacterium]
MNRNNDLCARRPAGALALALLGVLLAAANFAAGQVPPGTSPAADAPPATQPTTEPQPAATEPAADNISPDAVALTEQERILLGDVTDGVHQLDEDAFYLMFNKAAELAEGEPLGAEAFERLEAPSYARLLRSPAAYRAQPIQFSFRAMAVKKLSGNWLGQSRYWPQDRPVWQIAGFNARAEDPTQQPVVVYSIADPTPLLGEPDEVDQRGGKIYRVAPRLDVPALFYKLVKTTNREGKTAVVPVVVAWEIVQARSPQSGGGQWLSLVILVLVLAMAAGYYFIRRRVQRLRQEPETLYQPHRNEEPEQAEWDQQEAEDEVDPELRSIAEEYRKQRQQQQDSEHDDHADHRSG